MKAPAPTQEPPASKEAIQYAYFFGGGESEGTAEMKNELGGKGAGVAEMTRAGLPVPPGFTIQTEACREYMRAGQNSEEVERATLTSLHRLEELQKQTLGTGDNPLL